MPEKCNLAKMVKEKLIDQFKQIWFGLIYDSAKCLNYRIFKTTHCFESYIEYLPDDLRIALSKFRCVNHKLPIERGRFWGLHGMTEYVIFVIQLNWGMNTIISLSVPT